MTSALSLSVPDLRFLWRAQPDARPLPVAFTVPVRAPATPVLSESEHRAAAIDRLVAAGHLEVGPYGLQPSRPLEHLFGSLVRATAELTATVDIRLDSSVIRNRVVLAAAPGGAVVEARVYESRDVPGGSVVLAELDTGSPARAAVRLLKALNPGRHAFRVPVADLERAVRDASGANSVNDREAFVAVLRRRLGPADARDLYHLARYGGQYSASFTAAAAFGGSFAAAPDRAVTVRETDDRQHYVVSEADGWTHIEPARATTVVSRLDELLAAAHRRAERLCGASPR